MCLLNKTEYLKKLKYLLSSKIIYSKLPSDRAKKTENKNVMTPHCKANVITVEVKKRLLTHNAIARRICGLIKILKKQLSVRFIISSVFGPNRK